MFERVRAHKKSGASNRQRKRRPKTEISQDSETSKSEPSDTYPCSFWQLIGMAISDGAYTRRLISIFFLIVVAILLGLVIITQALRELHVSHRMIWPIGITGGATTIIAVLSTAVASFFKHRGKPGSNDEGEHDNG
jgi:hypothetical protein